MPRDELAPYDSPEMAESDDLRSQVDRLELQVGAAPQVDCPTLHGFGHGFYARSLFIPAGTVVVGKLHATEHIFMVTQGDISITTDEGVKRIQAPYQCIGKPGSKRAVYAHTDTVCVNIHLTYETDLEKLEAALIVAPALQAPEARKEIK